MYDVKVGFNGNSLRRERERRRNLYREQVKTVAESSMEL
jgi:hypothetical protein